MFCPGCGTENTDNSPICKKCGFNFSESLAPPPSQPMYAVPPQQPKSKAPILIISCVVIFAIIFVVGIIAAIAIPSLLNARRNANQNAAMAMVKCFSTFADDYASSNEGEYFWDDSKTDFSDFWKHGELDGTYSFIYFSNSNEGKATAYIYVGIPDDWSKGRCAYLIDENNNMYRRIFEDPLDLAAFSIDSEDIDWEIVDSNILYLRLKGLGIWGRM